MENGLHKDFTLCLFDPVTFFQSANSVYSHPLTYASLYSTYFDLLQRTDGEGARPHPMSYEDTTSYENRIL